MLAVATASMAAHPVGWAIGAPVGIAVIGVGLYYYFKED